MPSLPLRHDALARQLEGREKDIEIAFYTLFLISSLSLFVVLLHLLFLLSFLRFSSPLMFFFCLLLVLLRLVLPFLFLRFFFLLRCLSLFGLVKVRGE